MPHPDALRWDQRYTRRSEMGIRCVPRVIWSLRISTCCRATDLSSMWHAAPLQQGVYLASHGWQVIALDVSIAALRIAQQKARKDALPDLLAVMDLTDPWLPCELILMSS